MVISKRFVFLHFLGCQTS
uniref:Uncharacterized protein n=1 Tax=Rhizophora mucronata TaxID=61149 RepID=A0A2P2K365_RHIMU